MDDEAYQLSVPRNEGILSDERCLIRQFDNPATARKYCQLMSIAGLSYFNVLFVRIKSS